MNKKRIALFASGGGSNALKILAHFKDHKTTEVALLVSNNKNAGILEKTEGLLSQLVITNEEAKDGAFLIEKMQENEIDYIVLAGYLRKIPTKLIQKYPKHIINIHPALLPKYGGKGMYGMNVHHAVHKNQEKESGITIHIVDDIYDNGETLYQHRVVVDPEDTPESIQQKVLEIEHQFFSSVIDDYINKQ